MENRQPADLRFQDAAWYNKSTDITIGGAGGIGSWLALALARNNHKVHIFDNDTYEHVNLAGQLVAKKQVGISKVTAIRQTVEAFTENTLNAYFQLYKKDFYTDIMVAAFDNMEARKLMFETWLSNPDRELFIDGRLTAEHYEIYVVTPKTESYYLQHWFPSSDVEPLPCSYKSTTFMAMGIASTIVNIISNYLSLDVQPYRTIPYCLKYQARFCTLEMYESEEVISQFKL